MERHDSGDANGAGSRGGDNAALNRVPVRLGSRSRALARPRERATAGLASSGTEGEPISEMVAQVDLSLPDLTDFSREQRARYVAALRRLADEIEGDALLTVQQAATLVGRTEEAVRVWARCGLGEYDQIARRYLIKRSLLVEYVRKAQGGTLPAGLQNLSLLKAESA
jgi:hypothetical protein